MDALKPVSTTREPSYPSRRAVRGLRRAAVAAAASAALLLGACGGADDHTGRTAGTPPEQVPDEVRLSGEAPPAQLDDDKPWKPEPLFVTPDPVLPDPEPVRLGGIARPPHER